MTGTFARMLAGILPAAMLLYGGATHAASELKPWRSGATPPLILQDAGGVEHRLSTLRGKVVLVNFWATWCEPCREEMPSLIRLKQQMGEDVEILAVNLGESEQKVQAFLKTVLSPDGAGRIVVLYDRDLAVARRWKATLAPASFVIAPSGRIAFTLLGEADWGAPGMVKSLRGLSASKGR